jgi:type I restriction enzyme S subunit
MTNTSQQSDAPTPFSSSNKLDLPFQWEKQQLKEIAKVRYGKARPEELGEIPVVGSGGVYGSTATALVDFPTLIIGRKGTAGMVWLQEQPCWPSDTTFYLEWKTATVDYHFVYYVLLQRPLSGEHARTTLPSLLRSDVENYTIAFPPQLEQRAVVRALGAVKEAEAARQRETALERERKAALMGRLFTYGIRCGETKQSEIGKIARSWEVVQLSNIVRETVKDGTHSTPAYVSDGVPFITTKDIIGNRISFENCAYISREEHNSLKRRVFPEPEDILLTKVGSVGNVAIVDTNLEFSIFVQLALIKPNFDEVYPKFLMYALQSEKCQQEIYKKSSQSTMRFIGTQKISTIRVPLPALHEQYEIASVLQACDAKIGVLDNEIKLLNELFTAMLEELMTGKLDVKPLTEVAEA